MIQGARRNSLILLAIFSLACPPIHAETVQLVVAKDKNSGYKRSAFKHWIDADKNGCDTRAEVLIQEAIATPQVGARCKLVGGLWNSPYDAKVIANASEIDIDHLIPLEEAWRSGAWSWSKKKRQDFANDLEDSRALIAVSFSSNRSKGDKDPASWMPKINQCKYISDWIAIKWRYKLRVDQSEAIKLQEFIESCGLINITIETVAPTPAQVSTPTSKPTPLESFSYRLVTAGAFCAQSDAGSVGQSSSGILYTCKVSSTENKLRWRQ